MAQNYEIDIKRFNGQDYDTLLPTPASHASTHQADGSDPITMQTGNYANGSVTAEKLAPGAIPNALGYNPGMVNPNLLDNWYFVGGGSQQGGSQFPVNQRGQTSYSDIGYIADRWKLDVKNVASAQIVLSNEFITINGAECFWGQYHENINRFVGKTLTGSILMADGALLTGTIVNYGGVLETVEAFFENDICTFYINRTGDDLVQIEINNHVDELQIIAVKLELGSQQTLAHQENGVWVLNEIPDYGEQLARCQRYFVRAGHSGIAQNMNYLGLARFYSNIDAIALLPLPVQMRSDPVTVVNGTFVAGGLTVTQMIAAMLPQGLRLHVKVADGGTGGNVGYLENTTYGAYVDFIADL